MSFFNRAASTVAVALVLAGCGGGVPGTATVPDGAAKMLRGAPGNGAETAPSPTVYLMDSSSVYAFPLLSNGTVAPVRTITLALTNHFFSTPGLATSVDGTVDILDNYWTDPGATLAYCRITVESASATGSPAAPATSCDPTDLTQGEGIARNTVGGFDVIFKDGVGPSSTYSLRRFGSDGTTTVSTLPLPANLFPMSLATDRGGHDYIDNNTGRIVCYKATATNPAAVASDITIPGNLHTRALAVSPGADRTVYVATTGSPGLANGSIYALAWGTNTILRTIGPFPESYITALAVDSQGSLYAAMNPVAGGTGANIRVYDSNANGKPTPLRRIFPNPAITEIRGLALSE